MLDRQKRLNEVYEHLHNHFGVHTKSEFADIIGYARAYISSALNGNEKYLTDKLFSKICDVYPGVFNHDYLLNGRGDLLTVEEEVKSQQVVSPTTSIPPSFDFSIIIEHAVKAATAYADQTIESLKSQLSDKDKLIASKDEIIAGLQSRIRELEQIVDNNSVSDFEHYPFPLGAADNPDSVRLKK